VRKLKDDQLPAIRAAVAEVTGAEIDDVLEGMVATKAPRPKAPKKMTVLKKSDKLGQVGLDAICEMIREGQSLRAIAKQVGVQISTLSEWLSHPDRSARARATRALTAQLWDEKAEEVLKDVNPAAEMPTELGRARELAQHYRWRASKINPKEYGDKLETTHQGGKTPIRIQPVSAEEALAEIDAIVAR
jgi:transposase